MSEHTSWTQYKAEEVNRMEAKVAELEAQLRQEREASDAMKQIESSTLPCGHHYRNGVTEDGGKTGHCVMCTLQAQVAQLKEDRDTWMGQAKRANLQVARLQKDSTELAEWKEKDSFVTLATVGFLQSLVKELCDENTELGQQVAQLQTTVGQLQHTVNHLAGGAAQGLLAHYKLHGAALGGDSACPAPAKENTSGT